MNINAGELNHFVALRRRLVGDVNTFGENPAELDVYAHVYAKRLQERPGMEIQEGGQVVAKSPAAFLVRYDPRIMASDVVDDEGRLFEITSVRDPDGGRVGLFLECNHYAPGNG